MDLTSITKGGVKLRIHPEAMAEHKRLGWVECPDEQADQSEQPRRGRKPKADEQADQSEKTE